MPRQNEHYQRITRAIIYLQQHGFEQPNLDELAEHLGLSPAHFQRVFSEWAGVSPKRFLQSLTKKYLKLCLRHSSDVMTAAMESGLSSPGRAHDLMVQCEAVTPGEYRANGDGLTIQYGFVNSPFGKALIGLTERGICHLQFVDREENQHALSDLQQEWPDAELVPDAHAIHVLGQQIFSPLQSGQGSLSVLLKGTNFQIKVWEALLSIDLGQITSYGEVAKLAGKPKASRAVGSALAANQIAYLIPCHRVIRESGEFGQYRWGPVRKSAMLAWEQGHAHSVSD